VSHLTLDLALDLDLPHLPFRSLAFPHYAEAAKAQVGGYGGGKAKSEIKSKIKIKRPT
jgi:hypothetical protein